MSEAHSANPQSNAQWLTVSQAAAALGRSERTTRRMCESGTLAATVQANESGGRAWFIERASVERAAKDAAMRPKRADVRPNSKREKSVRPQNDAAIIDRADSVRPQVAANDAAMLLREKEARINDLRAQVESQKLQIEAANRQAAEATAALREYLKLQAKALPGGTANGEPQSESSTRNDAAISSQNDAQATQNKPRGKETSETKNVSQKAVRREMRPLWKVVLGIR